VTQTELEKGVGEILIEEDVLQARIGELGTEISTDYAGRDLLLVGVATGPPEPLGQLPGEPVRAAHAKRHRPVLRVDPADRLIGQLVPRPIAPHHLSPFPRFLLRSHSAAILRRAAS